MPRLRVLGLLMVAVAACSPATPLPAAEYFPVVEEELARLDQATRDLTDRYAAELEGELAVLVGDVDPDDAAAVEQLRVEALGITTSKMQAIIEAHTGQVDLFVTRVEELVPPEVIAGRHEELVAAFRGWAASGEGTVTDLGTAGELGDLAVLLRASPYADARLRVDEFTPQQVARDTLGDGRRGAHHQCGYQRNRSHTNLHNML